MRKGEQWPARIRQDMRQRAEEGSEACTELFTHYPGEGECRGVIQIRTTREAKTIPNNYAIERSGRKTLESPARP